MMAQRLLPFQFQAETQSTGMTGKAGLALYLELMAAMELPAAIDDALELRPTQGWSDLQHIVALILLHLAGGDFLEDLHRLEADQGLCELMEQVEGWGLHPCHRQELANRWRVDKQRTFPSPDATADYLEAFDADSDQARAQAEGAFVPEPTEALRALRRLVAYTASWTPRGQQVPRRATLDVDASIVESHKRSAKPTYKKGVWGFQPLNVFWWERQMAWFSEFRDGNCPAAWRNPDVFDASLAELPEGVEEVRLRTDTAGYDHRLLKYCADGHNDRFGVIEFGIGVDVTPSFKRAVRRVDTWHDLETEGPDGMRWPTGQQWARVDFVPDWLGYTKRDLGIRYFAIRQPLVQPELFEEDGQRQLPFPTMEFADGGPSKVFGLVTNRRHIAGDEVIRWHRKRCGWSEQAHSEFKHALAGAHLPSSDVFGANCAWWQIMLMAYNLHVLMQTEVLAEVGAGSTDISVDAQPDQQVEACQNTRRRIRRGRSAPNEHESADSDDCLPAGTVHRIKTERFRWLNVPARVIRHARRLIIRLPRAHQAVEVFTAARQRIAQITRGPPTRWMPV